MNKKIIYLFVSIALFGASVKAQDKRTCSTMENLERLKAADPKLAVKMQEIENHTEQIIANRLSQDNNEVNAVINIPVVVHVLYNTTAQNISTAQIQSQIDVLNEDFRKLNADRVNTPSVFASIAADAEINFCLASKDPNGVATSGIIRKSTTVTSFSSNDAMKYSTQGGSNAWPTGSYLNIWVCNLGGGLLGYAQFPGGPAATDGVVINYKYFGRGTGTTAPYNKGRTATHEVGHWFNLRHIWGDDGTGCTGSDNVTDTPNQGGEHYGCPSFPTSSCSNGANGDMFMNYMDYTDDGCMNMFSNGQKTRMRALLTSGGARYSLVSSTGCSGGTTTPPPTTTTSTLTIGTGTGTMVAPYGTYYMDEKSQFIITKAELVAAGYSATNNSIKALAFNVASVSTQTMNGFSIKIKHTTSSAYSSTSYLSNTGATTVFSGNVAVTATGWKTHTFTTPFTYNGVDNLLVEICWNNSSYTTDTKVYCTTQTTYKTIYKQQDISSGGICTLTAGTQTYTRPNMRLTMGAANSTAKLGSEEEEEITFAPASVFEIFPNPASTKLNVKYTTESEVSNATVIVYNLMGAVISKTEMADLAEGEHDLSIDLTSLNNMPDGIYMLNLNVNGVSQTKRFILTH